MTNTDNMTIALMVVLFVNVFLFLGQYAVLELNENAPIKYNMENSILCTFDKNNCELSNYTVTSEVAGNLPTGVSSISPTTGNVFTDTFSSIKSWVADSTGVSYIYNILKAPSNFLNAIGVPPVLSFSLGALWYGITLFFIVAFMWGR